MTHFQELAQLADIYHALVIAKSDAVSHNNTELVLTLIKRMQETEGAIERVFDSMFDVLARMANGNGILYDYKFSPLVKQSLQVYGKMRGF